MRGAYFEKGRYEMNNMTIRNTLIAIVCCMFILLSFGGCASEREYYDDIHITLQDSSERITIKEWSYLLGSGAEVYYQKNDAEPVLLGKTTGGDDGFCPFKEGLYELSQDGNTVTVKWCFNPSNKDKSSWKHETFELPTP